MEGSLPVFLGLGVQKGGTTTLHGWLSSHPQVHLPPVKELHYFSLHHERGPAWYAARFADAPPGSLCGDITPYYIFHPEAPRRIQALLPEVRLIVLLRDPVDRALSQYFHSRRLGFEPLELEEALAAEPERLAGAEQVLRADGGRHRSHQEHSYVSRSRYEQQLARYQALFAPEQLLVLRSEDLFAGSPELWRRLLTFLELAPWQPPAPAVANAGGGEALAVPAAVRQRLRAQLDSTYQAMARDCGISWEPPTVRMR
ncbi:sulfotransferase [Synechococcus sp. Cruz-9H2]|uniref:sulfotransferase family protein n=1 Tax=unclassified Synechococcus TaxID=2626047 RepID=UPI0020CF00EF|nr:MULTISPECIES: sulfotransferase [unclassified Synechococcus]MCP9819460.1 sulfotransferase [Synechococcus sp. Cruz-9H2]MCP9843764.1 sulfotransferase [Synechococcus sp. Edmonson 11F2]MCP9855878.1 sulfotransferase [Synechococcus sp. Cruz-9C9]MCP9863174.1 sulfotransferase [Synechococcus sp. Cruz-7E5]MCP9870513.1 sulfotransferase [Synechococcus sp. Cruz-7B9]